MKKNKYVSEENKFLYYSYLITFFLHYHLKIISNLVVKVFISIIDSIIPNLVINCPTIFLVMIFLMVPSSPSDENRTWNYISVLSDDSHVTQPVTIHHNAHEKRPRTLDLLPEPKRRKTSLKRSKTSIVGYHGVIFHYQNEEPVLQPSSFILYIIPTLYTWII